jgi:hypothetical protein
MTVRVHSFAGSGLLVIGLAAAIGCGGSSPASPTMPAASGAQAAASASNRTSGQASMRPAADGETFALAGTLFSISNGSGDSISGTYSGSAIFSANAPERAALTLQITAGTGTYAGAKGTVSASGTGAFADEGAFTLDARGDVVLEGGKHAQITVNLSGTSAASCATNQILITQTGTGTMARAGRVTASFAHVVGSSGCIS